MKVKWTELFKDEFETRLREFPVIYLPMGLCEPHGHIAALGLDLIKAEYLCEEAAKRFGGIVAPAQGYHIHETGFHAPWLAEVLGNENPYMTSVPPAAMLYFFLYQLRAFHNAGFRQAIVVTGHSGGNQNDLRTAAAEFMTISDMHISVYADPELTNGKFDGDHAGKYELSQLMYIRPDLVNLGYIERWRKENPASRFAQGENASEASATHGAQIMETCLEGIRESLLDDLAEKLKQVRTFMPFEPVEHTWQKMKDNSRQWETHNLNKGQASAPIGSIWKSVEQWPSKD